MQVLGEDEVATLLDPKERVTAWIASVKKVTAPHFDEVHKIILRAAAAAAARRSRGTGRDVNKENSKPVSKL